MTARATMLHGGRLASTKLTKLMLCLTVPATTKHCEIVPTLASNVALSGNSPLAPQTRPTCLCSRPRLSSRLTGMTKPLAPSLGKMPWPGFRAHFHAVCVALPRCLHMMTPRLSQGQSTMSLLRLRPPAANTTTDNASTLATYTPDMILRRINDHGFTIVP